MSKQYITADLTKFWKCSLKPVKIQFCSIVNKCPQIILVKFVKTELLEVVSLELGLLNLTGWVVCLSISRITQ